MKEPIREPIHRIAYYLKKGNAFFSLPPHERNSFRGERLMQYKEAMNKRLNKKLREEKS